LSALFDDAQGYRHMSFLQHLIVLVPEVRFHISAVIPGKAGDSWRDPESRKFKESWIPAFARMTPKTL
jgi:hypothetical protein